VRLGAQEGQSLIIVVAAMFVVLAFSAFAIDLAQWYQKHHQAQVSADAAALAAANCLAHGVCTNTTPAGDAAATAASLASSNHVPISGPVTITNNQVTVTTATSAPVSFASVFGLAPATSAHAVAAYKTTYSADASVFSQDCASPQTTPITTPCTVSCSNYGVDVETSGNTNITGAIVSNGAMKIASNPNTSLEVVNYGDAALPNCSSSNDFKQNKAVIAAGPPALEPQFEYFPDTYQNDLENDCVTQSTLISTYQASTTDSSAPIYLGPNNTITLNGPLGTSSSPLHIEICALGDAKSLSGYTTINVAPSATLYGVTLLSESLTFTAKTGNNSNNVTVVGDPNITPDSGGSSPALAIYTTATSFTMGASGCQNGNNYSVTGTVFAPLAGMTVCGNNGSALLEANTVVMEGNNTGSGATLTLNLLNPIDYLTQ
jgi:hypothetical protein